MINFSKLTEKLKRISFSIQFPEICKLAIELLNNGNPLALTVKQQAESKGINFEEYLLNTVNHVSKAVEEDKPVEENKPKEISNEALSFVCSCFMPYINVTPKKRIIESYDYWSYDPEESHDYGKC